MKARLSALMVFVFALVVCAPAGRAELYFWVGTAGNNWSASGNWLPGTPVSAVDTDIQFEGTANLTPNQDIADPFSLRMLYFDASAGAFVVSGDYIRFAGVPGAPGEPGSYFYNDSSSFITVSAKLNYATDTLFGTTKASAGNVLLTGPFTGSANIIKTGNFTLRMAGSSLTYTGSAIVGDGTINPSNILQIENPLGLGGGGGTVRLNGGVLNLRFTPGGNGDTIYFGNPIVVDTESTIDVNRLSTTYTGCGIVMGPLTMGSPQLNVTGGNGFSVHVGQTTFNDHAKINATTGNMSITGPIVESVAGRSLTKTGNGTLTYTSATPAGHTGGTVVSGGAVQWTYSGSTATVAFGTGAISLSPGTRFTWNAAGSSLSVITLINGFDVTDASIGCGSATGKTFNFDGPLALKGALTFGKLDGGGGGATGGVYRGTITIDQASAGTRKITLMSGGNHGPQITGAVVDGPGGAGNRLILAAGDSGNGRDSTFNSPIASSTYSGGTIIADGGANRAVIVPSGGRLGTGSVTVQDKAKLRIGAATAVDTAGGKRILVESGGALGLGSNINYDLNTVLDPASLGVLGVDSGTYNAVALDMATIATGQMFLGSTLTCNYTAASLGPALGNVFRLGGGGGTLTIAGGLLKDDGATVRTAEFGYSGASGTVILNSAHSFSGGGSLRGITLDYRASGGLGTGTLTVNGGLLLLSPQSATATLTVANNIVQNGGQIRTDTEGRLTYFTGPVTFNSNNMVSGGNGPGKGTIVWAGNISGAGKMIQSNGGSSGTQDVQVLAGDNSAWTGGYWRDNSSGGGGAGHWLHIRSLTGLGSATTAYYNDQGSKAYAFFGENLNGTIANPFTIKGNSVPLINWALGPGYGPSGGNVVRLSGNISDTGSPSFNGRALNDTEISELVLAGSNAWSGSSAAVNFAGSGTVNFAAGPGGLLHGVGGAKAFYNVMTYIGDIDNLANQPVGAQGYIRFEGASSLPSGGTGKGYYAALQRAGNTTYAGRFGFLLTGDPGWVTYSAPGFDTANEKAFVIGSLDAGTPVGGVFGAAGGKAAVEKLRINIHAGAAADAQALTVLVRGSGDHLLLGTGAGAAIFQPTTGDSGSGTATTVLSARTGATTLHKRGQGVLSVLNAEFTRPGEAANGARPSVSWIIREGTMMYEQDDSGLSAFASVTVQKNATLGGSGVLNAPVTVEDGGIIAPGSSPGLLSVGSLVLSNESILLLELNDPVGANNDHIYVMGDLVLDGVLEIVGAAADTVGKYDWISWGGNLTDNGVTIAGLHQGYVGFLSVDPVKKIVTVEVVPEPASLGLLMVGGLVALRRRRNA